MRYHCKRNN